MVSFFRFDFPIMSSPPHVRIRWPSRWQHPANESSPLHGSSGEIDFKRKAESPKADVSEHWSAYVHAMPGLRQGHRRGLSYLNAVTSLLQRIRRAHPTAGLYEAADLQWWWSQRPRSTDTLPQLFWFDHLGQPEAAVIATDAGRRMQLDPLVMPEAAPDWIAQVIGRGLAHARASGIEAVTLEVDRNDEVLRDVLVGHGFAIEEDGVVESWLAAEARPQISQLHEGYRLSSRRETMQRPHHMISPERNHPDPEPRLRQMSLYRPDLDLVVHDSNDRVAAYGLFWHDPQTSTGLVEPMRTEDDHQRRGLARHVLTIGLDLLAAAGAQRIKICHEPDNPASGNLYRSVGFEPDRQTVVFAGRTSGAGSSARAVSRTPPRRG
jgi:RimJ/RimL family protein N-acetyltransferase